MNNVIFICWHIYIYTHLFMVIQGAMKGPCSEKDCWKGERCYVLTTSKSAVCLKTGMYWRMYQKVKVNLSYLFVYFIWMFSLGCRHKQYLFDSSTRTCYRSVVALTLSWANADAFCRNDGGYLISLDTKQEIDLLSKFFKTVRMISFLSYVKYLLTCILT